MQVLTICALQRLLVDVPQPLLKLPDSALEMVASLLPFSSAAQLQKTCRHLYQLLDTERYRFIHAAPVHTENPAIILGIILSGSGSAS